MVTVPEPHLEHIQNVMNLRGFVEELGRFPSVSHVSVHYQHGPSSPESTVPLKRLREQILCRCGIAVEMLQVAGLHGLLE